MAALDVVNEALIALGSETIRSITEQSRTAKAAAIVYPQARDTVYRLYEWPCLVKHATLAAPAPVPTILNGYTCVYALPADLVRVIDLNDGAEYIIEGNLLFTDEEDAVLKYLFQQTDDTLIDPGLRAAVVLKIAVNLAPSVGASAMLQILTQQYYMALESAKRCAGISRTNQPVSPTDWTEIS